MQVCPPYDCRRHPRTTGRRQFYFAFGGNLDQTFAMAARKKISVDYAKIDWRKDNGELAKIHGVTRTRIAQIRAKLFPKKKAPDTKFKPAIAPKAEPVPGDTAPPQSLFDQQIFGATPDFDNPPPDFTTAGGSEPGADQTSGEASDGGAEASDGEYTPPPDNPDNHRPLAMFIWDTIIAFMATLVGDFWLPRPVGSDASAGELPYDERENVLQAFCKYFVSIGMVFLTPIQELWLAIGAYCAPRLLGTIQFLKATFFKKKPKPVNQTETDTRQAKTETVTPEPVTDFPPEL